MQELLARIEQFRRADAPPAPARLPVDIEEANASCRRASEFMQFMQDQHIHPISFRRPTHETNPATHGYMSRPNSYKQSYEVIAKGWPIILPVAADAIAPGIRWALLETGRTYRLPLVASDAAAEELEAPVLSESTVLHPYAHPSVRRFPGAEEWQEVAPPIHGLDVLALAAIRLVDLDTSIRV